MNGDMAFISIFNDVLGPVMPGPSSSHTAGSFYIGRLARSLLGREPVRAVICFDPAGSYARVFRAQAVDKGFAAGLLGWTLTDGRFPRALTEAARRGLQLVFRVAPLRRAGHPNCVRLDLRSKNGEDLVLEARSTGGGAVTLTRVGPWDVVLDGKTHVCLIEVKNRSVQHVAAFLKKELGPEWRVSRRSSMSRTHFVVRSASPLPCSLLHRLETYDGLSAVRSAEPVFFVQKGSPLFASAAEVERLAKKRNATLGQLGLAYETQLLGFTPQKALAEMLGRYDVMRRAVARGLAGKGVRLKLLAPSAARLLRAERKGEVAVGGIHTRAAARALAVMHVSNSGGTICAAPTGGSAGTLAAVVMTLCEELSLSRDRAARALFAASAVGLIVAERATFAAETAGCQVEIGAAGAMAAAAVVEIAGGTARQACDAAAISFQNTMGSVCDLVQGLCEIPCHTRNAAAASAAFICADLVLGGYKNPIPLDETVDAVLSVGLMLPNELRCTARGGLALAPSAIALGRGRARASKASRERSARLTVEIRPTAKKEEIS
ncbi:MAG: L-serine ammonia-lyase, iron-sulfur-dependent, subunit alpha [Candidatus Aminicenantes bacterium]|nr:L-serine ammonia-lyase, iron-sulfur-dependent, subunit alpha [Candidatus Aminicenantes bacterium]